MPLCSFCPQIVLSACWCIEWDQLNVFDRLTVTKTVSLMFRWLNTEHTVGSPATAGYCLSTGGSQPQKRFTDMWRQGHTVDSKMFKCFRYSSLFLLFTLMSIGFMTLIYLKNIPYYLLLCSFRTNHRAEALGMVCMWLSVFRWWTHEPRFKLLIRQNKPLKHDFLHFLAIAKGAFTICLN